MSFPEQTTNGFHVEELKYFYTKEQRTLGLGEYSKLDVKNIGKNGENITIAVLSMNRTLLTIRLMESIERYLPNFKGEFLVGDNGSYESEKKTLCDVMKRMSFPCRMLEFDKNYGVAGGRNRLFAEVKTEWILSMDNDLYFVGNPFEKIQKDLWALGCHFMTMPVRDEGCDNASLYGGNLYVENIKGVSIGGGTALIVPCIKMNQEYDPFLCTFLSGCIAVIKKDTFFKCGGFEENMFVGFEDTEFSLRLFQNGYKVGSCGFACVIHDHPKPEKKADAAYEQQRFSKSYLKESAEYFEKKHGFTVWNPMVDDWVEKRLHDMELGTDAKKLLGVKTKVALVIDRRNWALDNIATQMVRNLGNEFDFQKIYLSDFDNLAKVMLLAENCSIIHFLWRPLASDYGSDYTQSYVRSLGLTYETFRQCYIDQKTISVAVYDHFMLSEKADDYRFTKRLFSDPHSIVTKYCVSSKKLWNIYQQRQDIVLKPSAIISDGVDLSLFRPQNLERFQADAQTIRVGWVGNSKWEINDLKGIHTIIRPAIQILKEAGYNIELMASDRQDKLIPHHQMPDYYNSVDLYICASVHEGTPNPVLEAMACGVPVISTDVGLVSELFGERQKKYILKERTVKCLVETLKHLLDQPEEFAMLSAENLFQIKSWDWTIMIEGFRDYLKS